MDLYHAALRGDLDGVRNLVTAANLHEGDGEGATVLHRASEGGQAAIVSWLLGAGAKVNAADVHGATPLHRAAQSKDPRCVELLLEAGADTQIADAYGSTPLYLACASAECAALLIAAHLPDVFATNSFVWSRTPLHEAARIGSEEVCRLLLRAGSVVDAADTNGHTPLYVALCNDRRAIAELLLKHDANLRCVKIDNQLPRIPKWVSSCLAPINACRAACWALLELTKQRATVVRGNGKDVLQIVARLVWESRRGESWATAQRSSSSKKCVCF